MAVPLRPWLFQIDAQGAWHLVGTRCRACGAHFFPRRAVCARCLGADVEAVRLSAEGILYTYTVVHQSTPEFPTPYILGYVDLPEGVRLLAPMVGVEADQVRIGMPVRVVVEPVRTDPEGRAVMGYRLHRLAEVPHG
ncbi:MAG: Zn-ribbon domain-containing OB-fold protein [Armatimonadetes bacterium]|nr:Zn-ribbon domain-containing OB-fold protein [Armatimonadota bacterium]